MENKIIFLDRDGVIIEDKDYVHKIEDLKFVKGAIEGLKRLYSGGYRFIIVTNQAGIGRGIYSEEVYFALRDKIHSELKKEGILILAEYFCPHHPEKGIGKYKQNCECRKPNIGMLKQASQEFNLALKKCWLIGDKNSDILAGKNAGCKTIHILTGEEKNPSACADLIFNNLLEVSKYFLDSS